MSSTGLRALKIAVVVMGVLIVAGTATLLVMIVRRVAPAQVATRPLRLGEPSGTGIANATLSGDRMVVSLRGGGPDRIVVLDLASGRVLARIGL